MKKTTLFSLSIMTSLIFVSCNNGAESIADAIAEGVENAQSGETTEGGGTTESGIFLRGDAVSKAMEKLKNLPKFKGKKIMVFQDINFHDLQGGRITLSISDPDKPENIDQYTYSDGSWSDPVPVTITGNGKISDNVTDLNEINYKAIPSMLKIADEKAKTIEGGKAGDDMITFIYTPTFNKRFFQLPGGIKGTRETYSIRFDKDGKLSEFTKN